MALTIVLLAGAGLMIRSFLNTEYLDLGVKADRLLVARVAARGAKYPKPENIVAFEERLADRLTRIQGIESFTIASNAPAGGAMTRKLKLEDRNIADNNNQFPLVDTVAVVPGYFQALGMRMLQGREFSPSDGRAGSEAAIVNQSFAKQYWPGENAIGKRIHLGPKDETPWITVVGVSPHIFQSTGQSRQTVDIYPPAVYIPFRQDPPVGMSILARTRVAKESVTAELRAALQDVDSDLPLFNIFTLDEIVAQRNWPYRIFGSLFAIFALIALVMSSVGIYAVTAYGINQRTQEIGVRMALGARQATVLWMVLRQALVRIAIGLSLGLAAAAGFNRILAGLLFQVSTSDPSTFGLISAILVTATVAASLVPARRAMKMDPVTALRAD
jgi:predicted permease